MIKYIIIDDETAAHDIIENYGNNLPYLTLKKNCYNALEAIEYLNKNKIDLMFLDINMPMLSGFDYLKTLSNPPKTIVTTAYKDYALEGYDLNVSDYLLKPFSFQRFIKAINKVNNSLSGNQTFTKSLGNEYNDKSVFLKDNKKTHHVKLRDILFVKAYGNYIKVYIENQLIVTYQTLSSFEKFLPENQFIRVHKSFIIAMDKIQLIEGNRILINEHKIPVGKMYKFNIDKLLK
jgi:DNA-binding LytR/AlgR family response regulator